MMLLVVVGNTKTAIYLSRQKFRITYPIEVHRLAIKYHVAASYLNHRLIS